MKKPDHVLDIFLQPGEFYFGDRDTRIRTLLGSCVSVTMWHPRLLLGGMCHYMMPFHGTQKVSPRNYTLDGKYAEDAMLMFFQEAVRNNSDPKDYVVKVFGGGNMFPDLKKSDNSADTIKQSLTQIRESNASISSKNVAVVHAFARHYNFKIAAAHLGGVGHRTIIFDVWSGHVWMRKPEYVTTSGD